MKKVFSILLCLCIIFTGLYAFAEETVYDDIQNHWAKNSIELWSSNGIVNGYNGNFRPDDSITRGEFATVLNRIFLFDEPSANTFEDLDEKYYTEPILCLNNQGIMNGFENNIRPNDYITREEAATMLYKALQIEPQDTLTMTFEDQDNISDWAKLYVTSLINKGFFKGDNGKIRPNDNITRAETVTLLDNGILLIDKSDSVKDTDKVLIINKDNLELEGCVFNNDVFVTSNVKNLVLDNVSVKGTVFVLSKSEKAVTLKNCNISKTDAENVNSIYEENISGDEEPNNITVENENKGSSGTSGSGGSSGNSGNTSNKENVENATGGNASDDEPVDNPDDNNIDSDDTSENEYENSGEDEIPEELKPTIETTLEDNLLQRNSKKVFDVIAKDASGEKIECRVRCNDINIEPSWDDETKTSFTLEFQESREYLVEITATDAEGLSQTKTYNITYEMAEYGEPIGKATVCIEAFTIGGGYIVAPIEIDVLEGVNCAYLLDEFLADNNLSYMSTGSLDGGFYLATISDIPEFTPVICETLLLALTDAGYDVALESYTPNQLSEFDFTQGSGWMYCVNGIFPNVGFSEYYLQDGDVMRIQFTLAYGSDIGGASGAGYAYAGDFYEMVNRDELTKIVANIGVENCQEYMELISKPNLTADELSDLLNQLR